MVFEDPAFWRAGAISTITVMTIVLIMLTIDSLAAISPGGSHVPPYTIINRGALLVSGFVQAFVERAIGGSALEAFISGQENAWFVDGMVGRFLLAIVFTAGFVVLVWDVVTLGRRAPAIAAVRLRNERSGDPRDRSAPRTLRSPRRHLGSALGARPVSQDPQSRALCRGCLRTARSGRAHHHLMDTARLRLEVPSRR